MNRKIYRKIAKKHGVTAEEVRRDMQAALNTAYRSPYRTPAHTQAQESVLRSGDVPTSEEFIRHAAREVHRRTQEDWAAAITVGTAFPLPIGAK
jgi:nicotinamide mononucleotide (NMN) deamidase PncC